MTSQLPRRDSQLDPDGEPGLTFNNSGRHTLQVPGFGHPVPIDLPSTQRFAHGFNDWAQNRLTASEIAMLRLMNSITDRPRWYQEVYDPSMIAVWAEQALQTLLISKASWDWCMKELRNKADYYGRTKLTHVLESPSRICKSDELIPAAVLQKLASEGGLSVSPDEFPLVYGKTRVLSNGGQVGRLNAVNLAGQGETSREQIWKCSSRALLNCDGTPRRGAYNGRSRGNGGNQGTTTGNSNCSRCGRTRGHREKSWERRGGMFSADFQWLPCEVAFIPKDSSSQNSGTKVCITSYINNLHPKQHSSLYDAIGKCIEASIQPWNEVLAYRDRGRTPERIRTHGA